ncbi:MAG: c-type cytochrome [Planctomycetaceae bacterium]|jgi:uncharacterized repeat protein (TIGR03806 family)|nr:c-type cytochrome [Planctomycetaceae bacterium]MBT6153805.1 c-type cytochrome [Planctomycetaceae bacterium]MBT6485750.1 c-type cytochrome [Planctomycetaceae bacterium]MBT6497907.1 c-type cytochrome [Planctomycetaceae bacterium]
MRASSTLVLVVVCGILIAATFLLSDNQADAVKNTQSKPRELWTTSKVKGSPDPPAPFRVELAFPNLTFNEPLAMTSAPGTDRLFVAERYGKVLSFPNDPNVEQADVLLDLGKDKVIYGVAFHPKFGENGHFYVTYIDNPKAEDPHGTHVSRFTMTDKDAFKADPESEQLILRWPSGGHNGGCLKFGHDDFLYIGTGDSSGINDEGLNGQDITTLSGAILRIDVDHPNGENKTYGIPSDNPFVDEPEARGEIWAYGLRQPWKFTFDTQTGDLWTGNVGQDLWEMVFRIERGGNYGWSVTESSHPFRPERKRGPSPILPPIVEHDHANFRSITGGFVYRGKRLEDLQGAYIYGDYDTGRIWMLRYDGDTKKVTDHKELVDSSLRLVGFGEDHAGELYLVDHISGRINRLSPNTAQASTDFPRKLSQTGLFTSVKDHTPATGLVAYDVIAPEWADGASKERYVALPGESQIEFETLTYPQPAPGAPAGWKFPDGTVLVETLSLEMTAGDPTSSRRIETRILHHERTAGSEQVGDQYWQGYTYIWNDEQSDAVLLEDPRGRDHTFEIADASADHGKRKQTWHFPSRTECTVCHNMAAKYVLGVTTHQLNRDFKHDGETTNQLDTFDDLGLFTEPLSKSADELPHLVNYHDEKQELDLRARSYLHANCSHCHRKWGGGNAKFQLLATLDLKETGALDVRPAHGTFQMTQAKLLASGDPYRSVAFYRMAKLGPGRMPRLGSTVTDQAGLKLIHDWIVGIPTSDPTERWEGNPDLITISLRMLDVQNIDDKTRNDLIDRLLASTSLASRMAWLVSEGKIKSKDRDLLIVRAGQQADGQIRDLFERFLPEEQRTKRLGNVVKPEELLALNGNAERGRIVFFEAAGVQCKNCHKIQGKGKEVGPDLSQIGKKYKPAELLDTILNPSKKIEKEYLTYIAETIAGKVHTGLLVKKTESEVVLKTAEDKLIELKPSEVEVLVPQQKSLMPDLLLRDMTAQQVADLTAFLSGLKK